MKTVLLTLALAFSASVFANPSVKSADYYAVDFWPGEYPNGYQILKDQEVDSVLSPENPQPSKTCTLKKDAVLHPWAQKTQSEFAYLSPVDRFTASKDFEIMVNEGEAINVKAGDEVLQLSYLSEGYCILSANGKVGEDSCFGQEEDDRAVPTSASAFKARQFVKASCREGYEAWIPEETLADYANYADEPDPTVTRAEIVEYGVVKEP